MSQVQPGIRRVILFATPLMTLILLLLHPLPDPAQMAAADQVRDLDWYLLMAPIADGFLLVHVLFSLALALLASSVFLLLEGLGGIAAGLSRACAFFFGVSYIVYETIIGTVTAMLVRGARALPPGEQAVIGGAIQRNFTDPLLGDLPSVVSLVAWVGWVLAVVLAAVALRRSGKPLAHCVLLGLSSIFFSHASMLGPLGMLFFLLAVVSMERAGSRADLSQASFQEVSP